MARETSRTIQTFNSLQMILVQFHNILIAFRFVLSYYTAAGCLTFGRILLQLNCGVKDFATCKLGLEPLFSKFLVSEQVYVASKGYAWHHGIKVNDPSRYQRVCRKHALWSSPNLHPHQIIILALCFDKGQRLQDWPHGCPSQDQESTSFLSTQSPFPSTFAKLNVRDGYWNKVILQRSVQYTILLAVYSCLSRQWHRARRLDMSTQILWTQRRRWEWRWRNTWVYTHQITMQIYRQSALLRRIPKHHKRRAMSHESSEASSSSSSNKTCYSLRHSMSNTVNSVAWAQTTDDLVRHGTWGCIKHRDEDVR